MTRKIFRTTFATGAAILLACTVLFLFLQYEEAVEENYDALKGEAAYVVHGMAIGDMEYLQNLEPINRVTWIGEDGEVIYDSDYPIPVANQMEFSEVQGAMETGTGRAIRRSDTGGTSVVYYAVRCDDGTILRLSRPLSMLEGAVIAMIPVICGLILVLMLSGIVSYRMANEILKPVNELDLDDPRPDKTYPEIEPLVTRIREQQEMIRKEVAVREQHRKEFSANVTHELKTPLTVISGFAELMKDGLVPEEEMREFSGDIFRESRRLIALVEDILRLSRLDEEEGFPEPEEADLFLLAEDVRSSLKPQAEAEKIQIRLIGNTVLLTGVRQILFEMMYNLVDNAIKYNHEGGDVLITVFSREDGVGWSVSDTGIGIPKEDQNRVFERFYRVDKSHSKTVGGTGLGLSIVKHGASLHDAKIELDSEPGRGTVVSIHFPGNALAQKGVSENADKASI